MGPRLFLSLLVNAPYSATPAFAMLGYNGSTQLVVHL